MKKVYIATYLNGRMSPTRVFADNDDEAKHMAFATYMYNSYPTFPGPGVNEVVDTVTPALDQLMGGVGIQSAVQVDYTAPTCLEILSCMFPNKVLKN